MADINFDYHPQFFTATILQWKHLLHDDSYKNIIMNSLLYLKKAGCIKVYAFVIMPNHIHLIWQIQDGYDKANIQMRFLKFTAQQFKFRLIDTENHLLQAFKVSAKDREYQFWERNSLSVDLWLPDVFMQSWITSTIIHCNINGNWLIYLKIINIPQHNFIKPVMINLI